MHKPQQISADNGVLQFPTCKLGNEKLIEGIISGSPVAAQQFHQRYSASISRWVWHLIGTDTEHEDIVQQVLVGVISGMKTIKKPESLDSWVKSVTIRVVRDELRRRKRKRQFVAAGVDIDDDTSADPNSPWKQSYIRSFYKILGKMRPDDRIVFVLKHLEGYTNERIAQYCNYSVSTVKRRIDRAKTHFYNEAMTDYTLMSLVGKEHDVNG